MKRFICFVISAVFFVAYRNEVCAMRPVNETRASIAVLCENRSKAQEMINLLCQRKSRLLPRMGAEFTEEVNEGENSTVIYETEGDVGYNIYFRILDKSEINNKTMNNFVGAIILYDISDASLDSIVESKTFYFNDIERLISSVNCPLVHYIVKLQRTNHTLFGNWYNSLNFATFNCGNLTADRYDIVHGKINDFTCNAEDYYKVDNRWGRGHRDISTDIFCGPTLYWIAGQARRNVSKVLNGCSYL